MSVPKSPGDRAMKRTNLMTDDKQPKSKAPQPPVAFDPVEAALRQIFDDVAAEDIPADFADLVAQLTPRSNDKKGNK